VIHPSEIEKLIVAALPDARVDIMDRTGTLDHYTVRIVSDGFEGQNPLDRRRRVYKILADPMEDGRIHAIELKTQTPAEAAS
jgi:stress-induced morphogen